jgi:hypothetical protein
MRRQHIVRRAVPIGACAAGILLWAIPGSGAGRPKTPKGCVVAFQTGGELAQSGQLLDARESFLECAKVACGVVQKKCKTQVTRLEAVIASVAPVVNDESGAPLVNVQVKVDGELWASHLGGHALLLDPGVHEFSFKTDKGELLPQKVMIVEGQRGPLSFSLGGMREEKLAASVPPATAPQTKVSPAPTTEPPPAKAKTAADETPRGDGHWTFPASPFPYALGVVGLAAVGGGALLTYWGNQDNRLAAAQCHGDCPQSTTDHIKAMYLESDISLGVGVAALAVTTWIFARSRSFEPEGHTATRFDLQPVRSGAIASVGGVF